MMSAFRDFNLSFRSPLRERRPLMFHERILILKHFTEFSLEFSYTYYPVCVLFCYGRNLLNNMLATSHIVGIWEITVAWTCVNVSCHLCTRVIRMTVTIEHFIFKDAKITPRIASERLSTIRETQVFLMDPDWEKAQTSPATGIDRFAWAKQSRIFRNISRKTDEVKWARKYGMKVAVTVVLWNSACWKGKHSQLWSASE